MLAACSSSVHPQQPPALSSDGSSFVLVIGKLSQENGRQLQVTYSACGLPAHFIDGLKLMLAATDGPFSPRRHLVQRTHSPDPQTPALPSSDPKEQLHQKLTSSHFGSQPFAQFIERKIARLSLEEVSSYLDDTTRYQELDKRMQALFTLTLRLYEAGPKGMEFERQIEQAVDALPTEEVTHLLEDDTAYQRFSTQQMNAYWSEHLSHMMKC